MVETRKIVTVVFADVAGSTRLGEEFDAEAVRRVMERYFEEMRSILERHGGTVEKFIGDAVMAVFGIPAAHEDDALRAVRAAIEMRARLAKLNEELARKRGMTLALRIGVNTGEVVAGDPDGGQFYATGDAVNIAARFEQAAHTEEILLGEQTHRLVRDAVCVEAVEPLALKGKSNPVSAYRLLGVIEGAPALARRLDTPFVGRNEELAHLLTCFERAVATRTPLLVTAIGPPGVGKSRLAAEMITELDGRARILKDRCLSYGEGITFWPLEQILSNLSERPVGVIAYHAGSSAPRQHAPARSPGWRRRRSRNSSAGAEPVRLCETLSRGRERRRTDGCLPRSTTASARRPSSSLAEALSFVVSSPTASSRSPDQEGRRSSHNQRRVDRNATCPRSTAPNYWRFSQSSRA
jgi:class 3 adenylate cyclase